MIKNSLAHELRRLSSPKPFVDGYLSWLTNNYTYIEIEHQQRRTKKGNYSFNKLLAHMINIIITFSDVPLRLALISGLLLGTLGVTALPTFVAAHLAGATQSINIELTLASIISACGLNLLILCILGEYIKRLNLANSRRPVYLVVHDTKESDEKR